MSNQLFREAARLVDEQIEKSGEIVSAVERNKRVLGAMEQLRGGKQPDGTATLRVIRFELPRHS